MPQEPIRRTFAGIPVVIENPAGSLRKWRDAAGEETGATVMVFDYGFIPGIIGADGEELDCYIGPDENAEHVFFVLQLKTPAYDRYDEAKAFLGFGSEAAAKAAFLAHRNDGDLAYGGMKSALMAEFKKGIEMGYGSAFSRTSRGVRGPTQSFDASPGADGRIRIHVWDRFCTWGAKDKNGDPVEFTAITLGQMIDNWRSRGGRLAMCLDHESAAAPMVRAPAAAFYDALAIVRAAEILRFERLVDSTARPPDVSLLATIVARFASEEGPSPAPDGLWGWRCEVTPLGEDPRDGLRNYRGISPMFDPRGTDEQRRPIGYVLLDVAATNTPFQAGCELTFSLRSSSGDRTSMNPDLMKRMSMTDDMTPEQRKAAMSSYAQKMATRMADAPDDEMKSMASDCEAMAKMADDMGDKEMATRMGQMAARMKRMAMEPMPMPGNGGMMPPGQHAEPDGDEMRKAMEAMARELNLPPGTKPAQLFAALRAGSVPLSKVAELEQRVATMSRKLEQDAKAQAEASVQAFVSGAIEKGQYPASKKDDLVVLARVSLDLAAKQLHPEGTWPAEGVAFTRFTQGGDPVGGDAGRDPTAPAYFGGASVNVLGDAFAAESRKLAEDPKFVQSLSADVRSNPGLVLAAAQQELARRRPALYRAYQGGAHTGG